MARGVRRRRAPRDRGGEGRHGLDRFLGHILLRPLRPSRDRWARRSSSVPSGYCGPAGRSSTVSRRGSRRSCARARAGGTRPGPDHPPHHPHRKRGLRQAGGVADTGGRGAHLGWTAAASGGLRRGDACLQRWGGHAAHAVVDATVPYPTLCLSHARPCLGDGGQGPLRSGRCLTHHPFVPSPWSALRRHATTRTSISPSGWHTSGPR